MLKRGLCELKHHIIPHSIAFKASRCSKCHQFDESQMLQCWCVYSFNTSPGTKDVKSAWLSVIQALAQLVVRCDENLVRYDAASIAK